MIFGKAKKEREAVVEEQAAVISLKILALFSFASDRKRTIEELQDGNSRNNLAFDRMLELTPEMGQKSIGDFCWKLICKRIIEEEHIDEYEAMEMLEEILEEAPKDAWNPERQDKLLYQLLCFFERMEKYSEAQIKIIAALAERWHVDAQRLETMAASSAGTYQDEEENEEVDEEEHFKTLFEQLHGKKP